MNDSDLKFDRSCHALYTKQCKQQILEKIALHYPEKQRAGMWDSVQRQFVEFLSDWRTDLGGRRNFHNGRSGTYDCIALMSYFKVCRSVTSLKEIEEMEGALFLPAFKILHRFVNCNRPFWKHMMQRSFMTAKSKCDQWHDYEMHVAPFDNDKPIYYEFTHCPVAEFAQKHDMLEVMPALCNPDYTAMELIHAKLVRTHTCSNGTKCDYTICGDCDEYAKAHPEYVDAQGYRRND